MTITPMPNDGFSLARITLRSPGSPAIAIACALEVLEQSTSADDAALCDEWRAKLITPRADYAVDPWGGHVNIGPHIDNMVTGGWSRYHARQAQKQQRRRLLLIITIAAGALLALIMANAVIDRTTATVEAAQNWKG